MQLIKKVEIHYLRSIYSTSLDTVGDLNLFFGRNDSGKSNILRGLNLFFNEQTDPGSGFDFDIDMSDLRKRKATEAKGRQFVWIKVTFNVPPNYQKSLGREISVKKQWNRYGGDVNVSSYPALSGGKTSILTRFLNQIDFTYIPAIKDLEVYADLIERMYSSASENTAMLDATKQFIDAIGEQTETLTQQLRRIFAAKASLSAPTNMAVLFRNLDFVHGEDGHSLFKQKGDGVKARHLPELLRFINENEASKKYFLWGFEEPENSLDLSAASLEAQRFASFASRSDTQIFISSHSPAFYLAPSEEGCSTKRFFVEKQFLDEENEITPDRATSAIDKLEDADRTMRAAGLMQLPYVIRSLKDQQDAFSRSQKEIQDLTAQLATLSKPTLFVEGKHDVKSYPRLLSAFGVNDFFEVRQFSGTPKNTKEIISAISLAGGLSPSSRTLFLFDNDPAGRSSLAAFAGNGSDTSGSPVNIGNGNLYAAVLPYQTDPFEQFMIECGLKESEIKFPFEMLFVNEETLNFVEEKTKDDTDWLDSIHDDYYRRPQAFTNKLRKFAPGTPGWLYARMVPDGLKSKFITIALQSPNKNCEALKKLTDTVSDALQLSHDQ
ncbi:AAA ATPase domain-containing protein [Roseovarius litoreus]|uniref:AAA ATPase domain-containing protein n=1 Tax=Roseovarius litoreus TaxID=1155722 RepID=A0A1M7A462_9RHOB|nr:AAA family ATPase [Roseovarius litoreus]SHL37532.1 AAA ATPase domain-containing protein [Roseovarius litoreus]